MIKFLRKFFSCAFLEFLFRKGTEFLVFSNWPSLMEVLKHTFAFCLNWQWNSILGQLLSLGSHRESNERCHILMLLLDTRSTQWLYILSIQISLMFRGQILLVRELGSEFRSQMQSGLEVSQELSSLLHLNPFADPQVVACAHSSFDGFAWFVLLFSLAPGFSCVWKQTSMYQPSGEASLRLLRNYGLPLYSEFSGVAYSNKTKICLSIGHQHLYVC